MRYYNYEDNDEDQEDIDNFLDFENEIEDLITEFSFGNPADISRQLDQELLEIAINLVQKSIFWYFLSTKTRLKKIKEAYIGLEKIVNNDETDELF